MNIVTEKVMDGGEKMNLAKVNLTYIKEMRLKKNYSIKEVSNLLGYEGYQAYYYKEKGTRKMSAEDIALIAAIFNVSIESLFLFIKLPKR